MKFTPFFIGSGRASRALMESFKIAAMIDRSLEFNESIAISRQAELKDVINGSKNPIVCISNPHALHAPKIIEADRAGASLIFTEKPSCVNREQLTALKKVKSPVAVLHVYRQMWGVQALKKMIESGELGRLVSIEGRYWQSSAAQQAEKGRGAVSGATNAATFGAAKSSAAKSSATKGADVTTGPGAGGAKRGWKDDVALSGSFDTLIDIAVHWIDAALFLASAAKTADGGVGQGPADANASAATPARASSLSLWRSYVNAESPHRDSHVHVTMDLRDGCRALASVSKTVHGASNHFEINVIGSKKSATWKFLEPDQIEVGEGARRIFIQRPREDETLIHPPFHGLGWVEGYTRIVLEALRERAGAPSRGYPSLAENLSMMELIFSAADRM